MSATAVLFLALSPQSASALEFLGFCLSGPCKQEEEAADLIDPVFYAVDLEVAAPPDDDPDEVEAAIRSASQLWGGRDGPVAGSAGLVLRAKGDYRRIAAALQEEGRYAPRISILVAGREAASLEPGFEAPDNAQVVVNVDPGPLFRFGRTEIANQAPAPTDPFDIVKSPVEAGFVAGEPARSGVIRESARLAVEAWRQQGHPKAAVVSQDIRAIHPDRRLDASLALAPGPRADFGQIAVSGTRRMDPGFVAWMTGLTPGNEYDPDEIEKARKRLDRLAVFSTRRIEEADAVGADGMLPMEVVVDERKPRRFGIGATYSSIDGAGVETYFLHRNLFGRAERLRFDAKVGGLGATFDPQKFDYLLGATFTRPGVLTPDTDFVSTLTAKREVTETYRETSAGGSVGLNHYASEAVTLKGGGFARRSRFEDAFGNRNFTTTGLYGEAVLDFRDDKLAPTQGHYLGFEMQPFYEWEYANPAVRFEADARGYLGLGPEKATVLAGRVRTGSLIGPSAAELPPDLLFLEGGGGSVRGYAYRNIGVRNPAGKVVGGRSMFTASGELRQRLAGNFGAVAFVDAGTVSDAQFIDFTEPLKVGVGAGLRYYTGIGAIRFDVAVPLDPDRDDPDFGIYVGIGEAF